MTSLDLDLVPDPPASPAVLAARQRRALVVGLGGGRESDSPMAKSSFAERRLRATDTVSTRLVEPLPGVDLAAPRADRCGASWEEGVAAAAAPSTVPPPAGASSLRLDDALVVPAGALVRGYLRCHALLLVGDVVGNIHCTTGPVVIRSGEPVVVAKALVE